MHRTACLKNFTLFTLFTACLVFLTPVSAMTDMNGQTRSIHSLVGNGQWTIAKIWAADCHVCHKTIHYLTQFEQRFPEANVFGISIDGPGQQQKAQRFIDQFDLQFPNLLSDAGEIDDYLYAEVGETLVGTPTIIVYNPQGKVAAVQPGGVTPEQLIRFIRQQQAATTN